MFSFSNVSFSSFSFISLQDQCIQEMHQTFLSFISSEFNRVALFPTNLFQHPKSCTRFAASLLSLKLVVEIFRHLRIYYLYVSLSLVAASLSQHGISVQCPQRLDGSIELMSKSMRFLVEYPKSRDQNRLHGMQCQ